MDLIIRQILDVEKKAQQIVSEASRDKENFSAQIASEKNKLTEDILNKALKDIEVIRNNAKANAQAQILKIEESTAAAMALMDTQYQKQGELWAAEVLNRVVFNNKQFIED